MGNRNDSNSRFLLSLIFCSWYCELKLTRSIFKLMPVVASTVYKKIPLYYKVKRDFKYIHFMSYDLELTDDFTRIFCSQSSPCSIGANTD